MILFIDENGNTFKGAAPYIHWINGQLSIGLWHTLKLMILTTNRTIQTSELEENSIFKFIKPQYYNEAYDQDLAEISARQITSTGTAALTVNETTWYAHQILLVCASDNAGEFIEEFAINEVPTPIGLRDFNNDYYHLDFGPTPTHSPDGSYDSVNVRVGADLYGENEVLAINLSNRGLELPTSIQKAFLENNIKESYTDFALINRKFKELVSNFIDIVDNKGSYKSLYNSLKWFEWGKDTKLYEIWKNDGPFLEKELTPLLSERYHDLLFTHQKTTHLSLVASLQEISDDEIDDERNPMLEDIAYQWSVDELALKVSLLGAFFERYFMPIHLDLKRACVEALVYTHQVKALPGTSNDKYHIHDDTGVIDIEMDHTYTLGNIPFVAVGKDTMFAKRVSSELYNNNTYYIDPVGVDPLESIEEIWGPSGPRGRDFDLSFLRNDFGPASTSTTYEYTTPGINDSIATLFVQLKGGVGTIIPIKISVDLPDDDGLITEVLTVYGWGDEGRYVKEQVTERRLFKSRNGKASFSFNLLATQEEKVSFSLTLYSLSGHVWTGASSYEIVDVSGSYLDVCVVRNTYNSILYNATYNSVEEWVNQTKNPYSQDNKNPYARLYEYLDYDPNDPDASYDNVLLTQYFPYDDRDLTQYNQLIVVENNPALTYDTSWITDDIRDRFWVIYRASEFNPRYVMLITKDPGIQYSNKQAFISAFGITGISTNNIKRFDPIFIPQLHLYESLEDKNRDITYNNYCFGETDLLCVFPQFKKNVHITHTSWKFKNMTTLEEIEIERPIIMPFIASVNDKALSNGFWTVTMYYKLDGSSELHELSKNSAFKISGDFINTHSNLPDLTDVGSSGTGSTGGPDNQPPKPVNTAYWVDGDQEISRGPHVGTTKKNSPLKLAARTNGKNSHFLIKQNDANATIIEYGCYGYADDNGTETRIFRTSVSDVNEGVDLNHDDLNPGVDGEYTDYIKIAVPENTTPAVREIEIAYWSETGKAGSIIITQKSAEKVNPQFVQHSNSYSLGQSNYINIDNPSEIPYRLKLGSEAADIIRVSRPAKVDRDAGDLTETPTEARTYEAEQLLVQAKSNGPGGTATILLLDESGSITYDIYTAYVAKPYTPYDPDNPDPGDPLVDPDVPDVTEDTASLVDLGLPSGTLWMDRNIGANSVTSTGGRFAWGEISPRDDFDCDIYNEGLNDPSHFTTLTDGDNNPAKAKIGSNEKNIRVLKDYQNYVRNLDLGAKSFVKLHNPERPGLSASQRGYWINKGGPSNAENASGDWWSYMGLFEMGCFAGYLKNASMGGGNIKSTPWDAACQHYHDLRLCIPTTYQYTELCYFCDIEPCTMDGVKGYKFTRRDVSNEAPFMNDPQYANVDGAACVGNYIFIPCNSQYTHEWTPSDTAVNEGEAISGKHTYYDYAVLWLANGGTRNGSVIELYTEKVTNESETIIDGPTAKHNSSSYGMYFGLNIRACTSGRLIRYDSTTNHYTFNNSGNNPYFNIDATGEKSWDVIKIVPYNSAIVNKTENGIPVYKDYYECIPDALTVYIAVSDPCNRGWYPAYGGPQTRTGSGTNDTRNGRSGTNNWSPFRIDVIAAGNESDVGGDIADQSHLDVANNIPEGGKFYGNGIIAITANGYHLGRYYLNLLNEYNGTTTFAKNLIWIGGSSVDYDDYSGLRVTNTDADGDGYLDYQS